MADRANCEGCQGASFCSEVRERLEAELGIVCEGPEVSEWTPLLGLPLNEYGSVLETQTRLISCPARNKLAKKLMANHVLHNPRLKLIDLIMTNSIAPQLPLVDAIQAVINEQETNGHYSSDHEFDVNVSGILSNITVPTNTELVTHTVNGLGKQLS